MYRNALEALLRWSTNPRRKPLILRGARQVGKTWLALELGRRVYDQVAHVVFLDNENMKTVFEGSLNPARLLDAISIDTGVRAGSGNTLVVLDEVQECPRALTSLKMFQEQRPEIPIIAAGSLLGVALHEGASFPVGKVDHLDLHPLSFDEFLRATGEDALADVLVKRDYSLVDAFKERFIDALKRYFFIGGMPEAVAEYCDTGDYGHVRTVQERLLFDYDHDFSKHASVADIERIRQVWKSLPKQLAHENKKFVYTEVRKGARSRTYSDSVTWLVDSGLVTRVNRISKPGLPLAAYEDESAFKLFLVDIGLLGAASRLDVSTILEGDRLFTEFKGALAEQFVCQQLVASNRVHPCYWSAENSSGELDFIYDYGGKVFPVEVKAQTNVRSRSLRAFVDKYRVPQAIRLSLAGYREQDWMVNIPLYAVNVLPDVGKISEEVG